jgi:hypothetical protein
MSMSAALSRYLEDGGHFPEAITVCTHARDVARRAGDRVAEASALSSPGLAACDSRCCRLAEGGREDARGAIVAFTCMPWTTPAAA